MNAKSAVFALAVATFGVVLILHLSPARTATAAAPQNNQNDQNNQGKGACTGLPDFSALKSAITAATATETSGLNNQMWVTLVNRDGVVCGVAFSGVNRGAQWPGSRVISAQKANTANAFSLDSSSRGLCAGVVKLRYHFWPDGWTEDRRCQRVWRGTRALRVGACDRWRRRRER